MTRPRWTRAGAVVATAVIVSLVAVAALVGSASLRTTTIVTTVTETETSIPGTIVTDTSSVTVTSTAGSPSSGGNPVTEANDTDSVGLVLEVAENATNGVQADGSLSFTVALYNPTSQLLNLSGYQAALGFPFVGFPIAPYPQCFWNAPIEFAVLQGYQNASSIAATLPKGLPTTVGCHELGGPPTSYAFEPQSQQAILRGEWDTQNDFQTDTGPDFSNATIIMSGYYTPSQLPAGGEISGLGNPTLWTPGYYTLAVGDAWGGLAVLHFFVTAVGSASPTPPYACDPMTAQCREG
jgi:hypothetical protein